MFLARRMLMAAVNGLTRFLKAKPPTPAIAGDRWMSVTSVSGGKLFVALDDVNKGTAYSSDRGNTWTVFDRVPKATIAAGVEPYSPGNWYRSLSASRQDTIGPFSTCWYQPSGKNIPLSKYLKINTPAFITTINGSFTAAVYHDDQYLWFGQYSYGAENISLSGLLISSIPSNTTVDNWTQAQSWEKYVLPLYTYDLISKNPIGPAITGLVNPYGYKFCSNWGLVTFQCDDLTANRGVLLISKQTPYSTENNMPTPDANYKLLDSCFSAKHQLATYTWPPTTSKDCWLLSNNINNYGQPLTGYWECLTNLGFDSPNYTIYVGGCNTTNNITYSACIVYTADGYAWTSKSIPTLTGDKYSARLYGMAWNKTYSPSTSSIIVATTSGARYVKNKGTSNIGWTTYTLPNTAWRFAGSITYCDPLGFIAPGVTVDGECNYTLYSKDGSTWYTRPSTPSTSNLNTPGGIACTFIDNTVVKAASGIQYWQI